MNANIATTLKSTEIDTHFAGPCAAHPPAAADASAAPGGIASLKEAILSFDWEITEHNLRTFHAELRRLEEAWQDDKTSLAFLRILRSLGKYIRAQKAKTPAEVITLLYSVYNALEKVTLSSGMRQSQKNTIALGELQKYNALRQQLTAGKNGTGRTGHTTKPSETPAAKAGSRPAGDGQPIADDDDDMIPALADIPLTEGTISQWSDLTCLDQTLETEERLTEFFGAGTDEAAIREHTNAAIVPLQEADTSPSQGEKNTAGAQGEENGAGQNDNILTDLFSQAPRTAADELLLDMHLESFKAQAAGTRSPAPATPEERKNCATNAENVLSEEEIGRRLDAFFDDNGASRQRSADLATGGVVPLPLADEAPPVTVKAKEDQASGPLPKISLTPLVAAIGDTFEQGAKERITNEIRKASGLARDRLEITAVLASLETVLASLQLRKTVSAVCRDILHSLAATLETLIGADSLDREQRLTQALTAVHRCSLWYQKNVLPAQPDPGKAIKELPLPVRRGIGRENTAPKYMKPVLVRKAAPQPA